MLLNVICYHLLHKSDLVLNSCTYWMTYNKCDLHLQMNKVYNILIFSFPKQYYAIQLPYVITRMYVTNIMSHTVSS